MVKDHPFTLFYKTSYEQEEYKIIQIRKSLRSRKSLPDLELQPAYVKPPTISIGKKQHLMEMCKENVIKEVHWPLFDALETSNAIFEPESEDE